MDDNDMEYGFNIALLEDERTIPSFGRMVGSFVLRRSSAPVPEMATTTINNTKSKGSPRAPFTAQTEDVSISPRQYVNQCQYQCLTNLSGSFNLQTKNPSTTPSQKANPIQ